MDVQSVRIERSFDVAEAVGLAVPHSSVDKQRDTATVDVPYSMGRLVIRKAWKLRFGNFETKLASDSLNKPVSLP